MVWIHRMFRETPDWRRAWYLAIAALCVSGGAWAQSWPTRTVRVIVPYSPGANADLIARMVTQNVATVWGQQVILDNRPGGATNIGSALAAKSLPDGYTLLLAGPPNAINISLMGKLPYDFMTDFTPIVLGTRVPNVLAVHPSLPVRTLPELIALAKARPGKLSFASGGLGSANQMAGELLKVNAKIDIVHVPYKGSAPAITDTIGGHVEMLFAGISSLIPAREERTAAPARDRQREAPAHDSGRPHLHRARPPRDDDQRLVRFHGARRHAPGDRREVDRRTWTQC